MVSPTKIEKQNDRVNL